MNGGARTRVLFVDHESRLSGGQRDLVDLVAALDTDRFDLRVVVPQKGPLSRELERAGAKAYYLPLPRKLRELSRWRLTQSPWAAMTMVGSFAAGSIRLARLIQRIRPNLVHTNSMKAHLLAVVPCAVLRVPLVWHIRDIIEPGWLRSALVSVAAHATRRVVCLSEAAAEPFRSHPRLQANVRVVYNGIHLDRFQGIEGGTWRKRLGVMNGSPLVGMVGQIAHWKGQDVFIRAAADLAARDPKLRFALIGECLFPENEGTYAEATRRQAHDLGLSDRLAWAGWVDRIEPVMAALDVLVHASRLAEPFGRVLVEAMAAGTPIVSTQVGAGPEIVTADAGKIVPPEDPKAIADAVAGILADHNRRDRMQTAARAASRRFDIAATAEGVVEVWSEVLK